MQEPEELSTLDFVLRGGEPLPFFAAGFIVFCTIWLLTRRIYGCFRVCRPAPVRDVVLLITGPVCALLLITKQAALGTMTLLGRGIDAEYALLDGLLAPMLVCEIAFWCFVLGVIAFLLPSQANRPNRRAAHPSTLSS